MILFEIITKKNIYSLNEIQRLMITKCDKQESQSSKRSIIQEKVISPIIDGTVNYKVNNNLVITSLLQKNWDS